MKKYLKLIIPAIFLLITTSAFAFDWAIFEDYNGDNVKEYALYKALNGIPIKYSIHSWSLEKDALENKNQDNPVGELVSEFVSKEEDERMARIVEKAFYTWFEDTWAMIKQDGRSKEFADIKQILLNKVKLERIPYVPNEGDILFMFTTPSNMKRHCGENSSGCINFGYERPIVFLINPSYYYEEYKNNTLAVAVHEIGHYFALGDQYEDSNTNSLIHSTAERIGNYDSVMGADHNLHLSCDDVDGFINLIDLTLSFNNNSSKQTFFGFSKRAFFGWKSFCNDKENNNGKKYPYQYFHEAKPTFKKTLSRNGRTYYFKWSDLQYSIDEENIVYDKDNNFMFYYIEGENGIYFYYDKDDNFIKQSNINPHFFAINKKALKDPRIQ